MYHSLVVVCAKAFCAMNFCSEDCFSFWPQQGLRTLGRVYFLASLVLCFSFLAYLRLLGGPLGRIPGPFGARLSRVWMVKHSWQGDMHRTMIALHQRHGKIVRTGPNEVSVSDLAAIKKIYGGTR